MEKNFNPSKYFNNELFNENSNGRHLNFNGRQDGMLASGQMSSEQKSKAIIVKVSNSTTDDIANVVVLDTVNNTPFTPASGLVYSSGRTDVTYTSILQSLHSSPFRAGGTFLIASAVAQLNETIQVTYQNPNGQKIVDYLDYDVTIMQQQADRVQSDTAYNVAPTTKLVISKLLAGATLTLKIYPEEIRDIASFGSKPVEQAFGTPNTLK